MLFAPVAALQTKGLSPYAESRAEDRRRLMKQSLEKRGYATRVVHRGINTGPSSMSR